jgi:thymidylate synthase (FAD)
MLEHGDVCMEVSESVYSLVNEAINIIEHNLIELNDVCHAPKEIYLRRTVAPINNGSRYVISGNIRAWYEFFLEAATIGALVTDMYSIVNEQLNYLLDNTSLAKIRIGIDFDIWNDFSQSTMYCKLIKDMSILTPVERMVHETFTVLFVSDLLVQRELVRHRKASFAGESTRYCNYSLDKFDNQIAVLKPCFLNEDTEVYNEWKLGCEEAEKSYFILLNEGCTPQEARDVLPVATKCDTVVTTNLTEWRHIFNLRACDATGPAHPKMKEIMIPCMKEVRKLYPFAFGDLIAADEK